MRTLPVPEPDRLVRVYLQPPNTTAFADANPMFPLTFLRFREQTRTLARFEGMWSGNAPSPATASPTAWPRPGWIRPESCRN